jgi:hypothetical protein
MGGQYKQRLALSPAANFLFFEKYPARTDYSLVFG